LEGWTGLAAIAEATSTIRLGTAVTQIPLRNPGVLAHQAVTVDHISGGRLELGLGAGVGIDPSTDMVGIENWSNAERVARFGEYIELLDLLLRQPVTAYQGLYYSANEAVMNPSSVQQPRVPLTVAALAPKMMTHAARHADVWNTMSFQTDFVAQIAEFSERAEQMDEICAPVGRDPSTLRRSVYLFDAEATAQGGRFRSYQDEELLARLVTELSAIGFADFCVNPPALAEQLPAYERIANRILPDLRATHRSR
jgi:alkanesulfonate monooxygenase SsuD/methylene tetrahydromethanopterin reductase-like flavin-dependent oxidoreductase (luciferase family)